MTDSDAPKPAKPSGKSMTDPDSNTTPGQTPSEAGPAEAENNLKEPSENPDAGSAEQAAIDMMAALCRDLGLPGFPPDQGGGQSTQPQPMETAFQIIQRYLLDGDGNGSTHAPQVMMPSYVASSESSEPWYSAGDHGASAPTSTADTNAQWDVTTTHTDGSVTDMKGPVIADDMFRTAMPSLEGKSDTTDGTPDWSIRMKQGYPLSPTRTSAQTAIAARMQATDIPTSLRKWSLHVGATPDAQSELSVTVPTSVPSQLRALLFDSATSDGGAPLMSEVPIYGGEAHALHLEQNVGTVTSETTPDLAKICLILGNHAPVPIHLEYTGSLPSPIVAGSVVVGPNNSIPFWVQITPPSEGKKGAGLVVLVRYEAEASFDVTAQLLTAARTSTPTAILTCSSQTDHSACRAASMISDSRGRLETSLTGLPNDPDPQDLKKYGFMPPAFMLETNSTPSKPSTPSPAAKADSTTANDSDDTSSTTSEHPQPPATKSPTRSTKGKTGNAGGSGSSKGGT
ncbi:hypothetical protein UF64_04205 [Thalassospira sp. HJ]|uniref:hypothetical protein n=1 Tax=Thalassospira sp. HJ TaxID=1616823 RepID=UPI0005CE78E2|nr:hypothetical protein [Thalassospira sp. HJ]KJE36359.1 hypothetical protein UF64_04205 [Thalassospira sp. HJ]